MGGYWSSRGRRPRGAVQPRDNQQGYARSVHRKTVSPDSRKNKRDTLSKLMFSDEGPANVATCVNLLELLCEP
jgi:hypothetical protein